MDLITIQEFDLTHSARNVSQELFIRLAERARDLTEELCFGRAERNEKEARRAMKEMISYWIARGETEPGTPSPYPKSEAVGNYAITHNEEPALTVHGVSVSPAALLILKQAGLRNCGV